MAGRRDGPLMRDNSQSRQCKSRVTAAIAIGIFLGCLSAFFFPKGFLLPNSASSLNRRLVDSISQVGFAWTSCESSDTISLLKSEFIAEQDKSAELKRQIKELTEKLQFAEQEKGQSQKQIQILGLRSRPGPFGSVKSSRTNPTVVPDDSVNPKLAELLKRVAIDNELVVALANSNVLAMLSLWYENVRRVGVKNFLVVALDSETARLCESEKVPFHKPDEGLFLSASGRGGGNHAVSGLKFRVLRQFLELGYSVLLSDIDIVYLQNPFEHLRRDSDVESMTDGHDNRTAYGFDDVSNDPAMGWARFAHTIRHWVFNSGFFYIRPTVQAIELLDRVAARLARDSRAWDQAVFNEELFYPSQPGYEGLYASRRALDFYEFMNSKVLFKTVRADPELRKLKPVIVHVNYHPDKLPRMRAVIDFYVNGKQDALDSFPVGSA